jgi:hypothetical protein
MLLPHTISINTVVKYRKIMDALRTRLTNAFDKMDEQARQRIVAIAEQYAEKWPAAPQTQRLLRLVVPGDAKR